VELPSTTSLRELVGRIPRISLAFLPTPLQEVPRLRQAVGGPRLMMKRDDLTGLAFGGNKARKLEFMLADALAQGADIIVTSAAAQSNMLRMTCAACRQLGLDVHLVLRGTGQESVQGNLLLDYLFGAHLTFIKTTDPYSQLSVDVMQRLVAELKAQGRHPYVIDMRYESGALATLGYVWAAAELQEQFVAQGITNPTLVCCTGSGTTQAGLLLGGEILGTQWPVIGISVQQSADKMAPRVAKKAHDAAALLGYATRLDEQVIVVDDRWIGPAYGVPTPECIEAIQLAARQEGIVLDPVYSGKGLSGLIGRCREGAFTATDTVVFVHTGGTPALFAYADQLAPALRSSDQIVRVEG
jgi:D-cysteine desulfhydrase family pyridoxal phosphate-dependent enzyme